MARGTSSIEFKAPPERVFEFLSDPRNIFMANHDKPILEQSSGALGRGSWFVIQLDQLRARVEYDAWNPPSEIGATATFSGRGSFGGWSRHRWRLTPLGDGSRTRLDSE